MLIRKQGELRGSFPTSLSSLFDARLSVFLARVASPYPENAGSAGEYHIGSLLRIARMTIRKSPGSDVIS